MSKAPPVVKRTIQEKIAHVLELQENHDKPAQELAGNQESFAKYQQENQQRPAKNWESAARGEAVKAIAETENEYWADLRKRADEGDKEAKEEIAESEAELDILKIEGSWLEDHPAQIRASGSGKITISAAGTIVR
jgi:hypothetical protein